MVSECEYLQPVLNAILTGVMAPHATVPIVAWVFGAVYGEMLSDVRVIGLDGARCAGVDGPGIKVGEFGQRTDWFYGGGLHQRLN